MKAQTEKNLFQSWAADRKNRHYRLQFFRRLCLWHFLGLLFPSAYLLNYGLTWPPALVALRNMLAGAACLVIVWTVRWLRQQRKMVARLDDKLLYAAIYTDSFVVLLVSLGLGVMGFYDAAGGSAAAVLSYATAGGSWAASGVTFGLITLPAYQGYRRLAAQKGMG